MFVYNVYLCVYVCMFRYIYVCVCICIYMCICICMCIYMYVYVCICIYVLLLCTSWYHTYGIYKYFVVAKVPALPLTVCKKKKKKNSL